MTEPEHRVENVATDSHVGVQAGTVHVDAIYMTTPQDPPETKLRTGVYFLKGRMPEPARQLINEAMAGYATNEVYFYWLLAMVSGRTRHELSKDETARLRDRRTTMRLWGEDPWRDGVRVIDRLLESAGKAEEDIRVVVKDLDALREPQRSLILEHLELYLDGPIENHLWHLALTKAQTDQMGADRKDRIWKFFHPVPEKPRRREPRPPDTPLGMRAQAVTATAVLAIAVAQLGYLIMQSGRVLLMLAYLLGIAGAYIGMRNSADWRFRVVRRRAKDREYLGPGTKAERGSLAKKAEHRINYYFAKYLPFRVDRDNWLAETEGIRRSLRDEIAEVYAGVGIEKIAWLIRHRARETGERRKREELWSYRTELATPGRTRALAILGLLALASGGGWAAVGAVPVEPALAIVTILFLLISGWISAHAWLHLVLERRRHTADAAESDRTLEADLEGLARWRAKMADKPRDAEMASWLDCDRKVLLAEALRHYRLTMSDVIAHAFIEAPVRSSERARLRGGPWRHKKYQLLVFLITQEGVRQLTVRLDFLKGTFHDWQRLNYRFEAVASVGVSESGNDERTFQLTLVNGHEISVEVSSGFEELQQGESPGAVSKVSLDAAGIPHTLHVLEGIAAEGKKWVEQQELRTGNLSAALNDPE
ncbi:hypothetical protein FE391_39280 [Nonomuraea sp. KC401]|uniref:hypothetical protein n=1 Tax=unclassified Nonomuraea TaxID=2593643 RepID=UPI0010FEC580|nr:MULTISPECIES: hypothetical protein [unclassified Nonomuraea]NBE99702.1 hypothetical protein [Nonomuraea sp. K271]TLF56448.1 hypothetical protein FE391_39280 [Nonomuraea sp. KC401]